LIWVCITAAAVLNPDYEAEMLSLVDDFTKQAYRWHGYVEEILRDDPALYRYYRKLLAASRRRHKEAHKAHEDDEDAVPIVYGRLLDVLPP
jgi:hypothetical protein